MMTETEVTAWLDAAPGRLRPLWLLRGVTGEEICHGFAVRDLQPITRRGQLRLAWCDGGEYGRIRSPRLEDALLIDEQLRVAVFGGEYDVLPFNIENAVALGIPEADGMIPGDEEHEALVAYPYGFGDV